MESLMKDFTPVFRRKSLFDFRIKQKSFPIKNFCVEGAKIFAAE